MAVLNISLLASFLVDMWIGIITWLNNSIGNYALAVIALTVFIKVVLIPFDFFNKKVTRKNAKMQQSIQPQLEKLQKKYGNDKALYNEKMTELYKNNNYNVVGSCLFMLINLAVTFTIFISLLNGLNTMASRKITDQYTNLQTTYNTVYQLEMDLSGNEAIALQNANDAVVFKYNEIKDSFLWINNVWKADTITNSIPTFSEYLSVANTVMYEGIEVQTKSLTEEQKTTLQAEYELIMNPLRNEIGGVNGFYILLVLVVGTAMLAQWLSQRKLKFGANTSNNPAASTNKIMMIILPVILGVFALSSNSVFSLYLLTSQIITIAATPLIDMLIDKFESKETEKKQTSKMPEYSRTKTNQTFEKTQANDEPKTNKTQKGETK